jgi:hypothetical protein
MNPKPADTPEKVLLIIADISGYTRYMTANAKTLAHSQTVITELIHAIVRQIELPLEVAKLEGDAVFLFCRKEHCTQPWSEARRLVGEKVLRFFHHFGEKLGELSRATVCTCHACAHIEKLRLKIVAHSGEALFHQVLNFVELAGVDVIIVHRLLKNSVNADQYLLLTRTAREDLEFPQAIALAESAESYDDIGEVKTLVYFPEGETPDAPARGAGSFGAEYGNAWGLFRKLWFAPFASRSGQYRNVNSGAGLARKTGFALLTVVLTPIFVPFGAIKAFFRALKNVQRDNRPIGG